MDKITGVYQIFSVFRIIFITTEGTGRSPGAMKELSTTDEIYLGGYKGEIPYKYAYLYLY